MSTLYEAEGCCPLCDRVMQDYARNLRCNGKIFNFPFHFYYCDMHGIYVWRGRRHELFDLSRRMNQATNVEPEYPEVLKRFVESGARMPTLSDYKPVKMKCPYCAGGPELNGEWEQHYGYLTPATGDKTIICPWCSAEIPIEKVIKK